MNQEEEEDRVWDLLTHAKAMKPSPHFVRQVLREVRLLETKPSGLRAWLALLQSLVAPRPLVIGVAICAALAIILVPIFNHDGFFEASGPSFTVLEDRSSAFDPASEMAAIEYFGQLMAVGDPGLLDDASLAELFF